MIGSLTIFAKSKNYFFYVAAVFRCRKQFQTKTAAKDSRYWQKLSDNQMILLMKNLRESAKSA
ncbi:MAG: hypothetical protein AB8G11_09465 [Saprospiraceae bacterium]